MSHCLIDWRCKMFVRMDLFDSINRSTGYRLVVTLSQCMLFTLFRIDENQVKTSRWNDLWSLKWSKKCKTCKKLFIAGFPSIFTKLKSWNASIGSSDYFSHFFFHCNFLLINFIEWNICSSSGEVIQISFIIHIHISSFWRNWWDWSLKQPGVSWWMLLKSWCVSMRNNQLH